MTVTPLSNVFKQNLIFGGILQLGVQIPGRLPSKCQAVRNNRVIIYNYNHNNVNINTKTNRKSQEAK